jgi:hypothetical protein
MLTRILILPVLLNTALLTLAADGSEVEGKWLPLFDAQQWYKNQQGRETVFRGELQSVPNAGGPSTLQRTSYYRLGQRTIYTGARRLPVLDRLVGRQVELRGKAVDFELEGQSVREIWPAACRPAPSEEPDDRDTPHPSNEDDDGVGAVNAADEPEGQSSAARARAFWRAVSNGDTEAMRAFYAPKVLLKAGSELLKPQWKLAEDADRSKDMLVDRDRLLAGYEAMIKRIGKDVWTQAFGRIPPENVVVVTADGDDNPLAGVQRGDTVLKVGTGAGDDVIVFVFRKDSDGRLLVHLEDSDY